MCGIAGYVDFKTGSDEGTLAAMEAALTHRGPDEGNIRRLGPCGLVHRRLKIIDLSPAAAQPMTNEDGRLWIIFNGEIYNFPSLREELLRLGHRFRSRSDTEVLLHGYESWGDELFMRLRGMFALAIWDCATGQLLLARDRLGKKPLFYSVEPHRLVFGSELSVFRCVPDLRLSISKSTFREYLEYGYVHSPNTVLREVQRLPAGHFAVWSQRGLEVHRYWSLPTQPPALRNHGNSADAANALEAGLREAVASRLISDVPLGCFLSGGTDSSLVAALAQESLGSKLKTYTVGFESSTMNEAGHAANVARYLGTDHHELRVNPSTVLGEFESILARASEPLADDSFVPTFLISRETRRYVTVALCGDGGDELFAGYAKYRQFRFARVVRRWLPAPWPTLANLPLGDHFRKRAEAMAVKSPLELARWLSSLWKRQELGNLLAQPLQSEPKPDLFEQQWKLRNDFCEIERWMLTDMETYLEGDILQKVDRASMAVALETRSPFLDHQFVEQTLRWHCHANVKSGGKHILRQMLAKRLPRALFERPKQGFGMPIELWYREPLREMLLRYTDPKRIRQRGLLNETTVTGTVHQHLSGRRNFARKLHSIVAFEIWAEQFFGKDCALA